MRNATRRIIIGLIQLVLLFSVLCRLQPSEVFFSSKSLKNSSKKMFPFNFELSDNNSGFFLTKTLLRVIFMFFGCYGGPSLPLATQAVSELQKTKSN